MDNNGDVSARLRDINTTLQASNQLMAKMVGILSSMFPRSTGTFTMSAAASKSVTDDSVTTTSFITLTPTNAAAGTLQGSTKALYVTPAAGSFTVRTASGVAAAGTETFSYSVSTPV